MSTALDTQTTTKLKVPSLYKVVILNDDFTPLPFVVRVLTDIFSKSYPEAMELAQNVHEQGRGIVGTYTKEVADLKVQEANSAANQYKHPLKTISEVA
jgi:ATP-dependent Clp protease adaptor protein ClpS